MIVYPELGKHGRLGNHLFQMAATIGVALDHGDTWGFPIWPHETDFPIGGCFHDKIPEGPEYEERRFSFDPIPYQPELRLRGFFQSEKYFEKHAETIREFFTPKGMPPRADYSGIASLQVRRGDYLKCPERHPVLSMEYYRDAMGFMRGKGVKRFLVFSDDIAWCRRAFSEPGVEVIPPMTPMDQFRVSLACHHHIMANSTFSWWTAWLDPNPAKIVIAPEGWFGPDLAHYETGDLYAPGWVIL